MAAAEQNIYLKADEFYRTVNYYLWQYWSDVQHPSTKDYPFIDMPYPYLILVMLVYYLLVKHVIPWFMEDREPLEIRGLILFYNAVMALFNLFAFYECITRFHLRQYVDFDYPKIKPNTPQSREVMALTYTYLASKMMDLLDTIFFALRKKTTHISFLHLYHHITVPILGWLCVKINPEIPAARLFATLNSLIHFIMYSYYFMSAYGPELRKYLWWKRYITQIQLAQFIILAIYVIPLIIFQRGYPMFWMVVGFPQPFFFFYMFYDFYQRSYIASKQARIDRAKCDNNNKINGKIDKTE